MSEIKEVTKKQFRTLVWIIIGIGLLINGIMYYVLTKSGMSTSQLQLLGIMDGGLLITGFGVGLACSRMWKIKGVER